MVCWGGKVEMRKLLVGRKVKHFNSRFYFLSLGQNGSRECMQLHKRERERKSCPVAVPPQTHWDWANVGPAGDISACLLVLHRIVSDNPTVPSPPS